MFLVFAMTIIVAAAMIVSVLWVQLLLYGFSCCSMIVVILKLLLFLLWTVDFANEGDGYVAKQIIGYVGNAVVVDFANEVDVVAAVDACLCVLTQ